jgi:hypothetical protein
MVSGQETTEPPHVNSQPISVTNSSLVNGKPIRNHAGHSTDPPGRRFGQSASNPTQLPEAVSSESRAATKGGSPGGNFVPPREVWYYGGPY